MKKQGLEKGYQVGNLGQTLKNLKPRKKTRIKDLIK
jgi:hypothetical protein